MFRKLNAIVYKNSCLLLTVMLKNVLENFCSKLSTTFRPISVGLKTGNLKNQVISYHLIYNVGMVLDVVYLLMKLSFCFFMLGNLILLLYLLYLYDHHYYCLCQGLTCALILAVVSTVLPLVL